MQRIHFHIGNNFDNFLADKVHLRSPIWEYAETLSFFSWYHLTASQCVTKCALLSIVIFSYLQPFGHNLKRHAQFQVSWLRGYGGQRVGVKLIRLGGR